MLLPPCSEFKKEHICAKSIYLRRFLRVLLVMFYGDMWSLGFVFSPPAFTFFVQKAARLFADFDAE